MRTLVSLLFIITLYSRTDGQTLPINRRQKAYNNGTLIIEQLQRTEDAGTYTCMAQNKQKQTARRNVEIQVLSKSLSLFHQIHVNGECAGITAPLAHCRK